MDTTVLVEKTAGFYLVNPNIIIPTLSLSISRIVLPFLMHTAFYYT